MTQHHFRSESRRYRRIMALSSLTNISATVKRTRSTSCSLSYTSPYQGGSNIREAFLVNIANAWIDRQNLLDPIQMYLKAKYNANITLRFRNTVLTTLDSGAGTKKTLS